MSDSAVSDSAIPDSALSADPTRVASSAGPTDAGTRVRPAHARLAAPRLGVAGRLRTVALLAWVVGSGTACVGLGPQLDPGSDRVVRYVCEDGKDLEMRFSPGQGPAVLTREGRSTELTQEPAASGMSYSNGQITARGKGTDLRLEIGRRAPIACRAEG